MESDGRGGWFRVEQVPDVMEPWSTITWETTGWAGAAFQHRRFRHHQPFTDLVHHDLHGCDLSMDDCVRSGSKLIIPLCG